MFTELKKLDSEKKRRTGSSLNSSTAKQPNTRTPSRTGYPVPPKRVMQQRRPFDIYEDQYQTLKRIAEEERAQGLPGSMSGMVRSGIDMYLEARERGEL